MFTGSLTCKREKEEAYLGRGRRSCPQTWRASTHWGLPIHSVLCWLKCLALSPHHQWTKAIQKIYDLRQESFSSRGHSESCLLEAVCWPHSPQPGRRSFLREDLALPCGGLIIISINTFLLYTYVIVLIWPVEKIQKSLAKILWINLSQLERITCVYLLSLQQTDLLLQWTYCF